MIWIIVAIVALSIIGAIISLISDFYKNICNYFSNLAKTDRLSREKEQRRCLREQEDEKNKQKFIEDINLNDSFLKQELSAIRERQRSYTPVRKLVTKETERINEAVLNVNKRQNQTNSETEEFIKRHQISVMPTLWGYFKPTLMQPGKISDIWDWEGSFLKSIQTFSTSITGDSAITISRPEIPVPQLSTIPPIKIHSAPEFSEIQADYTNWENSFKKYGKQKFDLSHAELMRCFQNKILQWEISKTATELKNTEAMSQNELLIMDYNNAVLLRDKAIKLFTEKENAVMSAIQEEISRFLTGVPIAISERAKLLIHSLPYPRLFPLDFDLAYMQTNKSMVIDFQLPSKTDLPQIKERKYLKTKHEYKDIPFKEAELNRIYDNILYKITLAIVYITSKAIPAQFLSMTTFNGWVKFINPATGNEETACILSLQCQRNEILGINLEKIDPAECFRKLKGVGSAKLYGLVPIKPIIEINREDKRFVQSHGIEESLANVENIASMPWEEFEHLIRGLFEKEFSKEGTEVKVTRASRDGGVDAVIFDPDPLRGGKIVIQAKRYINTVGVEAVRDLFGTVHSENAIKGILVTTADYSPEACNFAKDKPITLINGNNLLHLLLQHGYNVKIDIEEARKAHMQKHPGQQV